MSESKLSCTDFVDDLISGICRTAPLGVGVLPVLRLGFLTRCFDVSTRNLWTGILCEWEGFLVDFCCKLGCGS